MYCQNCGSDVPDSTGSCPECGAQLGSQTPSEPGQGQTGGQSQQAQQASGHQHTAQGQQSHAGQQGPRGQVNQQRQSGQQAQQGQQQAGQHGQQAGQAPQRQQGQRGQAQQHQRRGATGQSGPSLTGAVSVFGSSLRGLGAVIQGITLVFAVFAFEVYQTVNQANADFGTAIEEVVNMITFGTAQTQQSLEAAIVPILKSFTWLFLNAQQIPIAGTGAVPGGSGQTTNLITLLSQTTPSLTTPLYYQIIPVVVLVWGGFRLAGKADLESVGQGGVAGAAIAIGYVPLMAALAVVGSVSIGGPAMSVTIGPDPVTAATMAAGYALVCGGIGGLIAGSMASGSE